jgi:hypothetical protein
MTMPTATAAGAPAPADNQKKLWVVHGIIGPNSSVLDARISELVLRRETPKYLMVMVRGSEQRLPKGRLGIDVFLSYESMMQRLRRLKDTELEQAKRRVKMLSRLVVAPIRTVPA